MLLSRLSGLHAFFHEHKNSGWMRLLSHHNIVIYILYGVAVITLFMPGSISGNDWTFYLESGGGRFHSGLEDRFFLDDLYAPERIPVIDNPWKKNIEYSRMGFIFRRPSIVGPDFIWRASFYLSPPQQNQYRNNDVSSGPGALVWTRVSPIHFSNRDMQLGYEFRKDSLYEWYLPHFQIGPSYYISDDYASWGQVYQSSDARVLTRFDKQWFAVLEGYGIYARLEQQASSHWSWFSEVQYYPHLRGDMENSFYEYTVPAGTSPPEGYNRFFLMSSGMRSERESYETGISFTTESGLSIGLTYRRILTRDSVPYPQIADLLYKTTLVPDYPSSPTSHTESSPFWTPGRNLEDMSDFYIYRKHTRDSSSLLLLVVSVALRDSDHQDRLEGQRVIRYPNGSVYSGTLQNGKYNGRGTLLKADGSKYEGEWKDGKRDGMGQYADSTGALQKGIWKNDQLEGQGYFHKSDGTEYRGSFHEGAPEGFGTMKWPDGAVYSGEWQHGERNGNGRIVNPDGSVLSGVWKDDQLQK